MFPSTGRYDRTLKRDKITKQLPTTPMQKGHQQLNYDLPMDNSHHQQLIEQQKSQLRLDDDKYFLLSIMKAHEETCDYTKDKATSLIEKSRMNPIYARCSTLMSCPLNPLPPPSSGNGAGGGDGGMSNNRSEAGGLEDFSERFSPAIRGVVEFAKRIPGFSLLSQDDQVTLLKAGVFEVLLVRLAFMFDKATDSMICLNGMVLKRDSLHSQAAARHLLDSMFTFAERLNGLNLTDTEIALFCSIVVISPDRPGLQNTELIGRINRKCVDLLNQSIKANHHSSLLFHSLITKITELRTLNTLHSEKLYAYKMGPKNGQSYNNLSSSSSSPSPSPISSSSTFSLSSINHHNGNSNSNSSNGDRNCNSPGNMNNPSNCSYASLLPVQWQNFTIRDTNEGPTSSSSSSSSSSHSTSSRSTNQSNTSSSYGLVDDISSSYDRNSVTPLDHILTKTTKSANGLSNNNHYSDADYQHNGHNQSQNGSSSSSLANHFILGQRLLQSSNNNINSSSSNSANNTNGNSMMDKNHASSRDSSINSLNHHQHQHHPHHHHGRYHDHAPHHHHYDNYCTNNGSSDVYTKMRRVDSPTDSGIESGKEQCNGSTPTASVCSSPRSACDDKVKDIVSDSECSTISEKNISVTVSESIDDMPMLKRALQAPPLINTNMLMDEAYRHHKKFRATKASRDCEPATSSTNIVHSSNGSNPNHCLASPTSTSSSSSLSSSTSSLSSACLSPPSSTNTLTNCDSLASTHSTLIKVLESAPRYIGDLNHNQQATSRYPSSSPPHHNNYNNNYTSLKKCDLLHSLIMKGSGGNGANNNNRSDRVANTNVEGGTLRVGDSMPPPLDLSRKRDLLYL